MHVVLRQTILKEVKGINLVGTATLNGESAYTQCCAISACTPASSGEGLSV